MECHVVGCAVLVCVCDVVYGAYSQDALSRRVNDGQVDNGPVMREEEEKWFRSNLGWDTFQTRLRFDVKRNLP